jgi:very-short-patch-repair endonuclease
MKDDPQRTVLVAIMNNKRDFAIAREKHWYRIPVRSAPRNLRELEVRQVAFYFTKVFEQDAYSVRWAAKVKRLSIVKRKELLPDEILDPRSEDDYFKIELEALEQLPAPIPSRRRRRLVFIQTTPSRLENAQELNDLYHESPLEEELWRAFKSENIPAERQFFIDEKEARFALDFAIFCNDRSIDVECDGDRFHLQAQRVKRDKKRSNLLESLGWSVLRYGSSDIFVRLPETLHQVKEAIRTYGGLKS